MSEILDDLGDPDRSPRATVFARAAHALTPTLPIIALVEVLSRLDLVSKWVSAGFSIFLILLFLLIILHQEIGRICIQCMKEVPVDAGIQAERKRSLLRLVHIPSIRMFGGVLIANGVIGLISIWFFEPNGTGLITGNWLRIPLDIFLIVYVYSVVVHHRLQPWCPFCRRWDDGGPREAVPDPDLGGVKNG